MAWNSYNLTAQIMATFFLLPSVTPRRLADDFGVTRADNTIGSQIYEALDALENAGLIEQCNEDVSHKSSVYKAYRLAPTNLGTRIHKLDGEVKSLSHQLGVANRRVIELLEQQKTWDQVKRLVEAAQ